jgi:chromate reductase
MARYRVATIIGSLREGSFNREFAKALVKLAPEDFAFFDCRIDDLPLYNQDDDDHQAEPVQRLKREIRGANGVLFVTPEYNRAVPGVLKNAIDNASRPYGDSAWKGKPAAVVGVSIGAIGTAVAQAVLRHCLDYLDMPTLGQPEVYIHHKDGLYDAPGEFSADTRQFLQGWMDAYAAWVRKIDAEAL